LEGVEGKEGREREGISDSKAAVQNLASIVYSLV
jgi:hypothetical protein